MTRHLTYGELLQLKCWNTATICNGWEQIAKHDRAKGCTNLQETCYFMPQMGQMTGYAVIVTVEPSDPAHTHQEPAVWKQYRECIAGMPGPKIALVQDLDKPHAIGSFCGEINTNVHKAQGCVGTTMGGAVRCVDEMFNASLKAIARRMSMGYAYAVRVEWGYDGELFGCKITKGALIHAGKHGFLVIPEQGQKIVVRGCLLNGCKRAPDGDRGADIVREGLRADTR